MFRKNASTAADKVRVLIVDDSELYRTIVRHLLARIPNIEVVDVACDGAEALEKIEQHAPDLITLDVEMPVLDGLGVLDEMRRRRMKSSVLMLSSVTLEGAGATLQSLSKGAFDFILKPSGGSTPDNKRLLLEALTEKIETWRYSRRPSKSDRSSAASRPQSATRSAESAGSDWSGTGSQEHDGPGVVVIGASTGGPDALKQVLPQIPEDFPLPILVVQHMPPMFTKLMADTLNTNCKVRVSEARRHNLVEPGRVLIAPGGKHMKLWQNGEAVRVELTDDPPEHSCRPSVDYLFRSAVNVFGSGTIGVIMTGMGQDGTEGCRLIKRAGGRVIAQDEESCAVFGMPRIPIQEGITDKIVPLKQLAFQITRCARAEVTV